MKPEKNRLHKRDPKMASFTRRDFLKATTTAAIGFGAGSLLPGQLKARPASANGSIGVAVVGLGFGHSHLQRLLSLPGVRLVACCDLDPALLQSRVADLRQRDVTLFATTDYRQILDHPDVDAVVIATPNQWHALHTIWACQAGKDVYVEKPISHTVWEGRKMIEAAERHGRIVQAGTQARSALGLPELIEFLNAGNLGRIQYIHAFSSRRRPGIGRRLPWYPDDVDYDLFCGPAPMVPLERNQLRYDWHWDWNTGNGDLGNLGIHFFDRAMWVAGHQAPPRRVCSIGARLMVNDAGKTPNAQFTLFDFGEIPILMENRSLPAPPGDTSRESFYGMPGGIMVQCEGGHFIGGNGGQVFDPAGRLIREFSTAGAGNHLQNFIDVVRSRRKADLKAPLEVAHASNTACLIGNISYRLGQEAPIGSIRAAVAGALPDEGIFPAFEEYLGRMGVDLSHQQLTLGPWLEFEPAEETFAAVDSINSEADLARARFLLQETFRPPYKIPG
jgi:predicted dehydrogenase